MTVMRSNTRLASALLVYAISAILISGCSAGEDRDYVVPKELCGAQIDPSLLEPLLPTGETLGQSDDIAPMGCTISIDSQREFTMFLYITNSYTDPTDWASGSRITT